MKTLNMIAVSEAAACPSSVVGYRSASARVDVVRSWRLMTGATGVTIVGRADTTRVSVAPKLSTDLRHTFVDPLHGSRSRTRCRLS